MRVSVDGIPQLRAAAIALRTVDVDVRREINQRTRSVLNPLWKSVVETNATWARDFAVIAKSARVRAGNPPVAMAATSRRKLRGGFVPVEDYAAVEFGTDRDRVRTYDRRSPNGGTHKVTRHTARQMPPRIRKGRIAYPAFAEIAPRMVSLWAQTIVRTIMDRYERAV